jgi:hypothetical protein
MTDAMTESERLQRQLEIARDLVIELATITDDAKSLAAAATALGSDAPLSTKARALEALRRAAKAGLEIADAKATKRVARFFADAEGAERLEDQRLYEDLHKLWPERHPPVVEKIAEHALEKRARGRPPKTVTQNLP